jgi:uncharacterized oxidoreductase
MKIRGNTILITGGGSGIGRALAHRFHDLGNRVIVTGRRLDVLQEAIEGRDNMLAVPLDVESSEAIAEFAQRVRAEYPTLNVLVNNAGIMRYERLDKARNLDDAEASITTNLLGPIRMIDAFVEHLAGQRDSSIVNVSSGLAFVPLTAAPTYSATKAAIHSYTVALRSALKGKIEVIELVPPAVQTSLTPGQENRDGYQPLDEFIDEVMALFHQDPTPPEILVERVGFLRRAEAEHRFEDAVLALDDLSNRIAAAVP